MIIKTATFNLFQFCSPEFSFYTKKEKFKKEDWEEKKNWIKEQLQKMDCDIVGFQEVFSQEELKELVLECGFKEFVVDLRKDSPTFGKWYGVVLSAQNKRQFFVPKGFAHGFLTLEDNTEFLYKCTDYYAPQYDSGILWNDKDVAVDWRLNEFGISEEELTLSEKDRKQQTLKEYIKNGNYF